MERTPMTPTEVFERAGRTLFGHEYIASLADFLGVEMNAIDKWRDGKSRVPPEVWSDIFDASKSRSAPWQRCESNLSHSWTIAWMELSKSIGRRPRGACSQRSPWTSTSCAVSPGRAVERRAGIGHDRG